MGTYREYAPTADLRGYVACTWSQTLSTQVSCESTPASAFDIIPDGCVDLVVYGDQAPHIAGPATLVQTIVPGAQTIHGIRLRPGAARAVLSCPLDRLLDRDTDLSAVCGRSASPLLDSLSADHGAVRHALEHWVRSRVQQVSTRQLAILSAATALSNDPRLSLDRLMTQLDMSARQLHRELSATCGYGPKLLQRIMRVQRSIRLATGSKTGLAELAASMGYADQAHMTRDFRALTGSSPARYLATANAEVGRWLDEY